MRRNRNRAMLALATMAVAGKSGAVPPAVGAEVPLTGWRMQDAAKVFSEGSSLSLAAYSPATWLAAVVPGTALTTLVANGVYPEPLYGLNNLQIPESLNKTSYWYQTTFTVPEAFRGRHVWLRFDGVNYLGEVWVNGQPAESIQGAFMRGTFDVTRWVQPGETAAVAVHVIPNLHPGTPHEQTLAGGTGRNGGEIGADGPTFNATVGWDWIPAVRDRDAGLWQGAVLYSTGAVTVRDPYVTTSLPLPRTGSATLNVRAEVHNESATAQKGTLEGSVDGTNLTFRVPVTLAANETKEVAAPDLKLANPRLWWPNGYGKPEMYRMRVRFVAGNTASDEKAVSFGVRTIDYFRGDDKNLTLVVNGVPVMARGGNWGMDEAMKRSPRKRLDAQIRMHRDANVNMIRNWVGQSTQEDFYDLCDRYGILVWDDFWLANPADGPVPEDDERFLANAREKILRFRNHPSIALWCGRNEGDPPPVLDAGLADLIKTLDGKRFYQKHSSKGNGVGGGGPYAAHPLADYFAFTDAFHTEIGAPSIPTVEAIQAMMPREDWWPINDDWAYHDLTKGAQQGDQYPGLVAARFGSVTGFTDFVRKSQLMNYETYRGMIEGRQSKLFAPATGVLFWMSNPAQPSFVWQLYSHDLEPNAAMFGTQKACEPLHVQMTPDGRVQVINQTPRSVGGTVRARFIGLDGKELPAQEKSVSATASAATDAMTLTPPAGLSSVHFVRLEFTSGDTRAQNFYWRSTGENPNDLSALGTLPTVPLEVSADREDGGPKGTSRFRVTLHNPGASVALMAHLGLRRASGERVLPVFYRENYVSLLPGETRTITVECATEDLMKEPPMFTLDGWNVSVAAKNKSAIPVTLNANAQP